MRDPIQQLIDSFAADTRRLAEAVVADARAQRDRAARADNQQRTAAPFDRDDLRGEAARGATGRSDEPIAMARCFAAESERLEAAVAAAQRDIRSALAASPSPALPRPRASNQANALPRVASMPVVTGSKAASLPTTEPDSDTPQHGGGDSAAPTGDQPTGIIRSAWIANLLTVIIVAAIVLGVLAALGTL